MTVSSIEYRGDLAGANWQIVARLAECGVSI